MSARRTRKRRRAPTTRLACILCSGVPASIASDSGLALCGRCLKAQHAIIAQDQNDESCGSVPAAKRAAAAPAPPLPPAVKVVASATAAAAPPSRAAPLPAAAASASSELGGGGGGGGVASAAPQVAVFEFDNSANPGRDAPVWQPYDPASCALIDAAFRAGGHGRGGSLTWSGIVSGRFQITVIFDAVSGRHRQQTTRGTRDVRRRAGGSAAVAAHGVTPAVAAPAPAISSSASSSSAAAVAAAAPLVPTTSATTTTTTTTASVAASTLPPASPPSPPTTASISSSAAAAASSAAAPPLDTSAASDELFARLGFRKPTLRVLEGTQPGDPSTTVRGDIP